MAVVTGGTPPFNYSWNFGEGAEPNTVSLESENREVNTTVTMWSASLTDAISYEVSLAVTDSTGAQVAVAAGYIVNLSLNQQPRIDRSQTIYDPVSQILSVYAFDSDYCHLFNPWESMTASLWLPAGIKVDENDLPLMVDGSAPAEFHLRAVDPVLGASDTVTIVVSDGNGGEDILDVFVEIPGYTIVPDTLYALSSQGVVVIITGATANPFQYLNGVGLMVDGDLDYEAGTFNVGAPGGGAGDTDGAWTAMNPAGGFLLPPDNFIARYVIRQDRYRIDFNLTPLGGSDVLGMEGMLMNFGLRGTAGTYTLGFQEFSGVERTYYTDGATNIYYWGTLMTDEDGVLAPGIEVDNTFTVN